MKNLMINNKKNKTGSIELVFLLALGFLFFVGISGFGQRLASVENAFEVQLQNQLYPSSLNLGTLAFPPSTVEGTSTAGWTDDGSIVRLNTISDFVGIGTVNPLEKLSVIGGNAYVSGTVYSYGNLLVSGGTFSFGSGSATSTLTSSGGNLGIASSSPSSALSLIGNAYISGTTTTGSLNVSSSTVQLNGIRYSLPATQGSANNVLSNNGSGVLSWAANAGTTTITFNPLPEGGATSTGNLAFNTNTRAEWVLYDFPKAVNINKISFITSAIGASGKFNIGVFDEYGTTRYLNHQTVVFGGNTGATSTTLGSTLSLGVGKYYFVMQSVDTTDITVVVWNCNTIGNLLSSLSGEPEYCGRTTEVASTLPTTVDPTALDQTQGGGPRLRFDN